MPIGYLLAVVLVAVCTLLAVSPRRRPPLLAAVSFRLGLALNELPFVAFYWLLASTLLAAVRGRSSAEPTSRTGTRGSGISSISTAIGRTRPVVRSSSTCTGGRFRSGGKSREARPLIHRLASQGWVCLRLPPLSACTGTTVSAAAPRGGPLRRSCTSRPAPPFFVAHGDRDTAVPVEDARRFAAMLRTTSASAVVYAELPGAQHSFDLFHSLRFERVVDAVERFAAWVRSSSE